MAGLKVQLVQEYVEQEQALIKESYRRRDELHHLHRLILIKADEREQKSRELLKAQVKTFSLFTTQSKTVTSASLNFWENYSLMLGDWYEYCCSLNISVPNKICRGKDWLFKNTWNRLKRPSQGTYWWLTCTVQMGWNCTKTQAKYFLFFIKSLFPIIRTKKSLTLSADLEWIHFVSL